MEIEYVCPKILEFKSITTNSIHQSNIEVPITVIGTNAFNDHVFWYDDGKNGKSCSNTESSLEKIIIGKDVKNNWRSCIYI